MMNQIFRDDRLFRSGERGSVYVIVVAGLSLLGLVTLTLSYTAQVEEQASKNWSEGIQARIGAVTGVPVFESRMGASLDAGSMPSGLAGGLAMSDPRSPRVFFILIGKCCFLQPRSECFSHRTGIEGLSPGNRLKQQSTVAPPRP